MQRAMAAVKYLNGEVEKREETHDSKESEVGETNVVAEEDEEEEEEEKAVPKKKARKAGAWKARKSLIFF